MPPTASDFVQVSSPVPDPAGKQFSLPQEAFRLEVPEGWRQGRGAFGGYVIAALTRATDQLERDPARKLRSVTATIPAPVLSGPADVFVSPLRIGSGVSTWQALLVQEGEVRSQATLVYGRQRVDQQGWNPEPPTGQPHWSEVEVVGMRAPMGPEFAQHFEFRPTGPAPFSAGSKPIASGWIRNRPMLPRVSAADVLALLDAWWPASFALETAPRPMATLTYTAELLADPDRLDDSPLYYRARSEAMHGGFCAEFRELWTAGGTLVGLNQQTFVMIR
ncbi:MAG: thioesterase family protein [Myxococcales bacterium]|nr:thioesterase family protein [Myxococcales bacterium]